MHCTRPNQVSFQTLTMSIIHMSEVLRPRKGSQLLFCPSSFSQRFLLPVAFPATIIFRSPRPILAKPYLCIRRIVEVDLRDGGLYKRPDAPIQSRSAAEPIYFFKEARHIVNIRIELSMGGVAGNVLFDEMTTD